MNSKHYKIIAGVLVPAGIVFGIILGISCPVDVSKDFWTSKYSFNVGLMFETWFFFDLLALFFGWLSAVLKKLENIESKISGEIDENKSEKPSELIQRIKEKSNSFKSSDSNNKQTSDEFWKCPSCGRVNANYVNTCACGKSIEK